MTCQKLGHNHSKDIRRVFYGSVSSLILCGFHYSQLSPKFFEQLRKEEVI